MMSLVHRMSILFVVILSLHIINTLTCLNAHNTGGITYFKIKMEFLYCQKPIDEGIYSVWNMMNETE